MERSKNKSIGKTKFYNVYKGKKDSGYFFYIPTVAKSPKKILNWDISVYSIFIAFGQYYIQYNVCEVIKDTNTEVFKENMGSLLNIAKSSGLKITDINAALEFLNKNSYLVLILKNANVSHPYVKNVVASALQNQSFVSSD